MSDRQTVRMALFGGGMFGGDVVLRTIEDLERCGIAPYLGRIGLDHRAREVASARFRLVAIGTRTGLTAERLCRRYRAEVPGAAPEAFHGDRPWVDVFSRHEVDLAFIATPDPVHTEPA